MSDEFVLTGLIRAVLVESLSPDVETLAQEVLGRIKRGEQRDALEQSLPYVIRNVLSKGRPSLAPPTDDPVHADSRGSSTLTERSAPASSSRPVPGKDFPTRQNQYQNYRDWLDRIEGTREIGADGEKFIGKFTLNDIDAKLARQNKAMVDLRNSNTSWSRIRDLLIQHKVTMIEEIPEAVRRAERETLENLPGGA